jgi:excisionase family DNA binding protein
MPKQSQQKRTDDRPKVAADRRSLPPPSAYPIAAVCRDFGVCRATIYNLMKRGVLRGVKIGNKRVFPAAEVEQLLSDGK